LVLSALKECDGILGNFSDVTPEMVELKDCSGHGGCKTFKVSVKATGDEDESPRSVLRLPPVVLHSRLEDHDEHFMRRLSDAHNVFAQHGLAPPRVAEGGDWFIGEWAGTGSPKLDTIEGCKTHGALFGRMHKRASSQKKYLKQQDLRDYLHVIATNAATYELKYFNISDAGGADAEDDDE